MIMRYTPGLVRNFNVGPIVIERPLPAAQDESGAWREPPPTILILHPICIHPHTDKPGDPRLVQTLQAADRRHSRVRVYTLQTVELNDRIRWQGLKWRVDDRDNWDELLAGVYTARATRIDPQDPHALGDET